jgi:hypothetical protein
MNEKPTECCKITYDMYGIYLIPTDIISDNVTVLQDIVGFGSDLEKLQNIINQANEYIKDNNSWKSVKVVNIATKYACDKCCKNKERHFYLGQTQTKLMNRDILYFTSEDCIKNFPCFIRYYSNKVEPYIYYEEGLMNS